MYTAGEAYRGRTWRIVRSFSFRFVLFHAGLFTVSVLTLFVFMAVTVNGFMVRQLDSAVVDEVAEVRADAGGDDPTRLRVVIDDLVRHSPGFLYLLQDAQGRLLAGNMTPLQPRPGFRTLDRNHALFRTPDPGPIRGYGTVLPDRTFLFVGTGTRALREVRESLSRAFFWSAGAIATLGLAGGVLMSLLVLRRIETVSRTSRAIMAGKLSQRIPLGGSNDEFDQLAGSLNQMLDRIETLMDGMRQISNDIAHDLRTPLSRLRQRLELARLRNATAAELHGELDGAMVQVDAILATFTALLRIAQIETRTPREGFAPVDLSALLADLADAYEPAAEEAGRTLAVRLENGLVIPGDCVLLTQLFVNLIENALRHARDGRVLTLSGARTGNGVLAVVADDGPGIPLARREFVFGRFARLDDSRTTPGSGLGLSLVRAIADLHDAEISLADNAPGLRVSVLFRGQDLERAVSVDSADGT